jgi:ABC-type uncharacterized transport system involved in gliding motility auxiliary subunit
MQRIMKIVGPVGFALTLVGAVTYGILSSSGPLALLPLAAGLALVAWSIVAGLRGVRTEGSRRSTRLGINAAVSIVALAAILIFLQTIAARHTGRWDTTANKRFSLSPQTTRILDALTRNVSFTCFYKDAAPGRKELDDLLKAYAAESPRVSYSFIDPDADPVAARRFKITKYNTIVVESGDSEEKIFAESEEAITNAILKVTRERKKVVRVLTGHGEKSIDDTEPAGLAQLRTAIEAESYEIAPLFALRDSFPDDCAVLLVPGPEKDLFPEEIRMIERYLAGGGAVLVLVDPMTDIPNLAGLLGSYGIEATNSVVVDRFGKLLAGNYLTPVVNTYGNHPIAKNFRHASFFPQARALRAARGTDRSAEVVVLAATGASAYGETDLDGVLKGRTQFDAERDLAGPVNVALVATREIPPAVPDPGAKPRRSRIAAFGDSDFASNAYLALSGNKDLILNTIAWLAEQDDLVAVRSRDPVSQPVILSVDQGKVVFWLPVVGLPAAVLLAGALVIIYRRRGA